MYNLEINFLNDPQRKPIKIDRPGPKPAPLNERMLMYAGVVAGLLPLALVGGFWFYQNSETGRLTAERDKLRQENAATQAQQKQIDNVKKQVKDIKEETTGLVTVFDQLKPWSAMLQDVRDRLPAGVQLTCVGQTVPTSSDIANCQGVQAASAGASSTSTTGVPATDTIVISGLTYNFGSINDFLLTLQQSPFFKPEETKLVISELKDYPAQWQQSQSSSTASGGTQPKLRKVVEFTIRTSLSDTPASKLLRELERKGALGLVTRIENLQQKGVLQNGLR
ncbi:PilN domain-containing protein [Microseira wollei]|uniref:Fimbrial assembly n=1 Tax=Microseira wollei NIES-4236 TaxID=2530354 RepID=A0AAV3XRB5_9CYAN|nr:PilN domain-containing protein [Microseira wollei]GET43755.1 Fimbrial assembly [Microseira wollei NIES-4236]